MTTLIPTAILLISLASSAAMANNSAGDMYGQQQWRAEIPTSNEPRSEDIASLVELLQATSRGDDQRNRILRTVFVVPGPDLAAEGIGQISEDLAVMCRIFDKATVWAHRTAGGEVAGGVPVDVSGVEVAPGWALTQGLYLDGYGAIFFLPVNFPLAAPPQEQNPSRTEPSGDPLWSQTADELRGVPQESATPSRGQYDAQRVENLKTALIGTLRHAANLRTRGPQDVITIVITSRTEQTTVSEMLQRDLLSRHEAAVNGRPVAPAAELPSALILRTTKSDVDVLAKGSLSQEQFAGKVQILRSWTTSSLEPAPVGATRPQFMVPQQRRR